MAPQADYLILKRRAQEEDRMTYETVCANNFKAASNAEWEIKTQGFIEHQIANRQYESIRAADEASLDARRQKLANMLAAESKMFQEQLEALSESPEERKLRMESRANELKEKRENEVCSEHMADPPPPPQRCSPAVALHPFLSSSRPVLTPSMNDRLARVDAAPCVCAPAVRAAVALGLRSAP